MQLTLETTTPKEEVVRPAKYRHPLKNFRSLAIANGSISKEDDMGVLRKACLIHGLNKAGWRFLNRYGKNAYAAVFSMLEDTESVFEMVLFYVIWQCRGGLKEPLAVELGKRLITCLGGIYCPDLTIDPRITKVANDHWNKLADPAERHHFAQEEWIRVINWMRDEQPVFDRNQWRSGWQAIYRKFQKWQRLNPERNTWKSILPAFDQGGIHVMPLISSYDLAQEGYRMRHCVASYAKRCLSGNYRLFSISEVSSGRPLATIGILKEENYWKIDQIKGRFNQAPEAGAARLGLVIQREYLYQEELISREKSRNKMMERNRCVEQLREEHEAYLCKQHEIPEVLRDQLSFEEIDFLKIHAARLNALASGELQPNAYEQVRFIAVTKGIFRPRAEPERIWVKYQRLLNLYSFSFNSTTSISAASDR